MRALLNTFLAVLVMMGFVRNANSQTETNYARAIGIVHFYSQALKLIRSNNDTFSHHDFSALIQQVKNELKRGNLQTDLIVAQINDSSLNSDRLDNHKKWLQDLTQTLTFAQSRLEYLLRRHQIENGIHFTSTQIRLQSLDAGTQSFIELITPQSEKFPGSFIYSSPFKSDKIVKSYLAQIINNQATELNPTPQLQDPINNFHVEIAAKQAATLQFQYRQKVERNVSSM
ncbi:MAG: hypothetical protein A4S09_11165 [Proteobacteria bacterium SG_bin7]|nr:MAG: hypothetical protein A4S09_11165 [Proteobacteria bacterium SG_bin7]